MVLVTSFLILSAFSSSSPVFHRLSKSASSFASTRYVQDTSWSNTTLYFLIIPPVVATNAKINGIIPSIIMRNQISLQVFSPAFFTTVFVKCFKQRQISPQRRGFVLYFFYIYHHFFLLFLTLNPKRMRLRLRLFFEPTLRLPL